MVGEAGKDLYNACIDTSACHLYITAQCMHLFGTEHSRMGVCV